MIISSFHTGPDRNYIHSHYEKGSFERISYLNRYYVLHMDPYVVTFHLGLGIGVIGPAFYISLVIWEPIHLFELLLILNREIGWIVYLFDIIYIYKAFSG